MIRTRSLVMLVALLGSEAVLADEFRLGRYITKDDSQQVTQYQPLDAPTRFIFPVEITSVGEAMEMALDASGYAVDFSAYPETYLLFTLPLPQLHRELGTLRLSTLLETLAGPSFRLHVNHLYRTVAFEAQDSISPEVIATAKIAWESRQQTVIATSRKYLVRPGDSVTLIAQDHGVTQHTWPQFIEEVLTQNPHAFINNNPDRLKAGVELELPL